MRRWLSGMLLATVVILGSWAVTLIPSQETVATAWFEVKGTRGEWVRLRTYDVRVTDVTATNGPVETPTGLAVPAELWLVVTLEFVPRLETMLLPSPIYVSADLRAYGDQYLSALTCGEGQPGIMSRCTFFIEIPREHLAGSSLLLFADHLQRVGTDTVGLIDLAIDETMARELSHNTAMIPIPTLTTGGTP